MFEAAAVAVPDARLGELVAAVVTATENRKNLSEQELLEDMKMK